MTRSFSVSRRNSRFRKRATNTPATSVAATSTAPAMNDSRRRPSSCDCSRLKAWSWYSHRTSERPAVPPVGSNATARTRVWFCWRGRGCGLSHATTSFAPFVPATRTDSR